MAVIDVHAHIYPEKIAERAVGAVGEFYLVDMYGQGTAAHLLASKEQAPLTHFVVHSVATKPSAVASINDFIAEQCRLHPEFIGFMAMHQDLEDPETEIERAVGLGLRGMKLHPDTQKVNMDDPRLMRIYGMIEGRLPLIVHTGDYRTDFSHPRRLKYFLRTGRGWLYLAAVIDLCTRMVVGYIEGFHNRARPHSTIGYQTPAGKTEAFMERCDAAFAEPAAGSDGMPLAA